MWFYDFAFKEAKPIDHEFHNMQHRKSKFVNYKYKEEREVKYEFKLAQWLQDIHIQHLNKSQDFEEVKSETLPEKNQLSTIIESLHLYFEDNEVNWNS